MEHRLQVYVGRDWLEEHCAKMDGKFQYVSCVGYKKTKDSLVVFSWRRDYNIVNNSWSVDAWRSLAGDVFGDAGSQRLDIMRVRMPWRKSGAVKESLRNYNCRKDREQSETVAIRCDAVTSRMVQRLVARKHCHVKVTWLWLRQAMDEIELWNDVMWLLMNLMGMNLVAGVECLVQQPRDKTTGTMIPDRDMDHEKRNCQRGSECLETIDGVRHEGNRSSIVEGLRAMNS